MCLLTDANIRATGLIFASQMFAILLCWFNLNACMFVFSLSQLDGTVDLDERRLIRSAIRDLRRREIEDMEAALASKRFRPTRLKQQEDKENQHR